MRLVTSGYQQHTPQSLVEALQAAGVDLVLDVRAEPRSRKPGFSRGPLARVLEAAGIQYLHQPQFGTAKAVREAYRRTHNREAFMTAYRQQLAGQADLLDECAAELREVGGACLLCLEADPQDCHRVLLAEELGRRLGLAPHHL